MANDFLEQISNSIGQFVMYGGGIVALSFLSFRFLCIRWVESKFNEKLEAFRHEQAKELARLKVGIDSSLSASIKLQEREFLLLPDAWLKLHKAYSSCFQMATPFKTPPNLRNFSDMQLSAHLGGTFLTIVDQSELLRTKGDDLETRYIELFQPYLINNAEDSVRDLSQFLAANGIFFPRDLKDALRNAAMRLSGEVKTYKHGLETGNKDMVNSVFQRMCEDVTPLHEFLETAIEARLQSHTRS